ncbi:hypothetical protein D3C80_1717850 [compost metagenome]
MQQVVRDDVELAQPFTAEDGQGVGHQLAECRTDTADKQRNDRNQHQRGAADAGQHGADLLQAWIADAQQLFDGLARGLFGGKNVFADVREHLGEHVETG